MVVEVARNRRQRTVDTPPTARLDVRELRFVEQPNTEVVHDVDRALLLSQIVGVLPAPADEAGPTRKLSEHARQIVRPAGLGNLERFE